MSVIQNQNLTLGSSQPEVTYWESTPQPSSAVNNTIVVLGVLTFALQLCLVLLFMLRCWSFDKRVRDTLQSQESVNKNHASDVFYPDIYEQPSSRLWTDAAAASPAVMSAAEEEYEPSTDYLCASFKHWDLVQ